jgi:RNA polymerase sigma-70 factor (ECF subfamily)
MARVEIDEFESLLSRARTGDEDAFAALFRAVQPPLLRYLRTLAHNLAEGTADDVAADAWVQVVRGLHRFRGDEQGFRAWVFTIARARLIDARRRSRRLPVPQDVAHVLSDVSVPSAAESLEVLFTTERALALIGTLPRSQAEVVLLRHVAGFDVAETARILGLRPGTVRVIAHRALRRLEDVLDGRPGRGVTGSGSDSVREVR